MCVTPLPMVSCLQRSEITAAEATSSTDACIKNLLSLIVRYEIRKPVVQRVSRAARCAESPLSAWPARRCRRIAPARSADTR